MLEQRDGKSLRAAMRDDVDSLLHLMNGQAKV